MGKSGVPSRSRRASNHGSAGLNMKISGGATETLFFGELFQHESGSLLVKYLARRAQEVCLVVPTSARRHLAAGIPCPVATVQDVFTNPLRAPNLLVHVQTDE